MNVRNYKYKLCNEFSYDQFLITLNESNEIMSLGEEDSEIVFYDTFDWRLFSATMVLYSLGNTFYLRKLFGTNSLTSCKVRKSISIISDFPESKLKNLLSKIVDDRAIFSIGRTHEKCSRIIIQSEDQKPKSTIRYFEYKNSPDSETRYAFIYLESIQEFPNSIYEIDFWLTQKGFERDKKSDILFHLQTENQKNPGDYSSKLDIKLKPDIDAGQALVQILNILINILKSNKEYLLNDNDPEFLHDFRVACRRIKSFIGNQDIIKPALNKEFKKDITELLKETNELRDLEVYLNNKDYYKSLLPKDYQSKINFLFIYLKRRKHLIKKSLITKDFLQKTNTVISKWNFVLSQAPDTIFDSYHSSLIIKDMASEKIYKNYNQILRTGKLILKTKDTKKLHELRINCKKLRYLMDIYKSLYPAKKIEILIKQIKSLQNNLGNYNDLFVQHKYLMNVSNRFSSRRKNFHDSLMAIGILVGLLHQKKTETAKEFFGIFKKFSKHENKIIFDELFS